MPSFLIDKQHLDLITVSGADAEKFLQGQLTCDIAKLELLDHCFGCACNNKGRIIAPFLLLKVAEGYHLILTAGLGELFIKHLQKFLPFYKCSMTLNPDDFTLCALNGEDAVKVVQPFYSKKENNKGISLSDKTESEGWLLSLGTKHPLFITCSTDLSFLPADNTLSTGDQQQWLLALMHNGHFPFTAEDSEQFTPQEIGLDRKHYINFEKGCYTGQEIVARMHYRGKLKKQLYLLTLTQADNETSEFLELVDADKQVVGPCMKTLISQNGLTYALINLPIELPEDFAIQTKAGSKVDLSQF